MRTIGGVDILFMNDAELRMLTELPNLVRAARAVMEMGPRVVVAKQGEYGAALFTEEGYFALPAFPLETVIDPTARVTRSPAASWATSTPPAARSTTPPCAAR